MWGQEIKSFFIPANLKMGEVYNAGFGDLPGAEPHEHPRWGAQMMVSPCSAVGPGCCRGWRIWFPGRPRRAREESIEESELEAPPEEAGWSFWLV